MEKAPMNASASYEVIAIERNTMEIYAYAQ